MEKTRLDKATAIRRRVATFEAFRRITNAIEALGGAL